jgi:hypothetical protein
VVFPGVNDNVLGTPGGNAGVADEGDVLEPSPTAFTADTVIA